MLVLSAGFKYFRTGITPTESSMDDVRSRQVEEVARFFNFPLHKLKNLDQATNNNVEHLDLDYYKSFLLTWLTTWEEELNRKLISPLEYGQQFIKHNANAFLRADVAGRTAFYSAMVDRGIFCADDVLEYEDLNPQPNGQGKLYLVQGAMVPKNKLEALADASIEKKKAPKAAPVAPAPTATEGDVAAANARAARAEAAAVEARADRARSPHRRRSDRRGHRRGTDRTSHEGDRGSRVGRARQLVGRAAPGGCRRGAAEDRRGGRRPS